MSGLLERNWFYWIPKFGCLDAASRWFDGKKYAGTLAIPAAPAAPAPPTAAPVPDPEDARVAAGAPGGPVASPKKVVSPDRGPVFDETTRKVVLFWRKVNNLLLLNDYSIPFINTPGPALTTRGIAIYYLAMYDAHAGVNRNRMYLRIKGGPMPFFPRGVT
jgi:hypothetical protein